MRLAVGRQRKPQRLLGAGLADRAGDADEFRLLRARAARARARSGLRARPAQPAAARPSAIARACSAATTASPAPALSAAVDEIVAVAASPLMAKKASPGAIVRRVDRNAGDARRQRARLARASRRPSPRPSTAGVRSCDLLLQRRRDRLMIAERQHAVADDLAGFVALARDQQHIAGPSAAIAAADRLAAVADLGRARRCGEDRRADRRRVLAARIVVGDDRRGRRSAPRSRPSAAACRHRGRRRAEHHDELALAHKAATRRAPSPARRACARSRRRSARRCARRPDRAGPWRPCSDRQRGEHRIGLAAGRDRKARRHQRILDLERADQRQAQAIVPLPRMRDGQRLRKTVDRRRRPAGCPRRCGRP